jgi:hypothetical protein
MVLSWLEYYSMENPKALNWMDSYSTVSLTALLEITVMATRNL